MFILIVCDLSNFESIQNLKKYIETTKSNIYENTTIILIGNKSDREDIPYENKTELQRILLEYNKYKYVELSAKNYINMFDIFKDINFGFLYDKGDEPVEECPTLECSKN